MVNFLGKAYSKVDDKGRIVFPAVFKKAMYEAGVTDMRLLVKKDVYANCLEVYTYAEWERQSDVLFKFSAIFAIFACTSGCSSAW